MRWVTTQTPVVVRDVPLNGVVSREYSKEEVTDAGRVPARDATLVALTGDLAERSEGEATVPAARSNRVRIPLAVEAGHYSKPRGVPSGNGR